jgi:hypothetical protein
VVRFALEDLRVVLLVAVFRVDLRVAAAERVLLVLDRFAFPRLLGDFLVALRPVAADLLPPAERLALPRLLAAPLEATFFLLAPRRVVLDFFRSPVRAPTNEPTALFATSTAAFTFCKLDLTDRALRRRLFSNVNARAGQDPRAHRRGDSLSDQ